ncbi:unnamed protein product [Alopecurus aequalis]
MASTRRKIAAQPSPHLPVEIMEQVLLRLPARSVVRFRAVCRSWAALVASPAFHRDYASVKADARQTTKFLLFASSAAAATAVYSCRGGSQRALDPLFTIDGLRPGFLLASSKPCHGLTLLADTRSMAQWVINASTGEHRRLPRRRYRGAWSAGLAYDDRAREHKVVQIFYHDDADVGAVLEFGCDVYTLGLGTTRQWRPASGGVPEHLRSAVKCAAIFEGTTTKVPPVFANGRLHWQLYPYSLHDDPLFPGLQHHPGQRVPVLCFSAAKESLSVVAGPEVEDIVEYCELDDRSPAVPLHLVELQGLLCMIRDLRHHQHGESLLKIWALRDYTHSVWSLEYRVSLTPQVARDVHSPRFLTVLGCIAGSGGVGNEAKKILIATSEHNVHAYDPATGNVETVLTIPEDVVGLKEEAVAGIRIGLYEDNFARVGGESHPQKEADSSMTQVLLRLPVKSIGICTLVCKQWCTLIESNNFVTLHMLANQGRRKVMMVTEGRYRKNFFGFTPLETWRAANPCNTIANGSMLCSKPCHGLNLISTNTQDYLCNPSTGSIRCLGIAGKFPLFEDGDHTHIRRHVLTDGGKRSVGLGFDRLAQEHVVVEITRSRGAPVCMVKTSCVEYWSCAGAPPRPVTDMPPAHVDGVLYWMSEPQEDAGDRVVVAFDIPTRAFSVLPCHLCSTVDADPFLMELEGEDTVVVPLEIDNKSGRILLNTGRALGYYDTRTGTLDVLYFLDQLHLPRHNLAFPMLYVDSLVRIQDDELSDHVTQPLRNEGTTNEGESGKLRYIFRSCEKNGCQSLGAVYTGSCCRRVLCWGCSYMCEEHTDGFHTCIPLCISPHSAKWTAEDYRLPLKHPSVPGPEYCYYNTMMDEEDDNVGSHIFVSLKDLARGRQPHRLVECGYRTDGKVIRETWVRRYRDEDRGF